MARLPLSLLIVVLFAWSAPSAFAQTAPGDFDGDGYSDLAIGVPRDSPPFPRGCVNVLYGYEGGISAADDQLFPQGYAEKWREDGEPEHFGYALATGDFDGDGFADLAGGAPHSSIGTTQETSKADPGAVTVLYGATEGLSFARAQVWHQDVPGIEGEATSPDGFGTALTTGDFNADGFDDLAVGVQNDAIEGIRTGAVNVLYGSATGLTASGNQIWHQDVPGVGNGLESNENGDRFGGAVAAGDFDDDGFGDLAVGAPREDRGAREQAGSVTIIYGSASGLQTDRSRLLFQDARTGGSERRDYYGSSLVVGNFGEEPGADLAVGAPGEDFGTRRNAGGVAVLYSASLTGAEFWHQGRRIGGHAEAQDEFGSSLAAADVGDSTWTDLAVGAPGEDGDSGAVNVIFGRRSGLSGEGDERWHQNRGGVPGSVDAGDRFGSSLGAADFGNGSRADLAVGIPNESVGSAERAGAVNVLYGRSYGLTGTGSQLWHQDRPGVFGVVEAREYFGFALAPQGSNPFSPHFSFPFA